MTNDLAFQFYSFSLGAGYTYIFQRYLRILGGIGAGYHFSVSKSGFASNLTGETQQVNRQISSSLNGLALNLNFAFSSLLYSYISLSARFDYTIYLSSPASGSTQSVNQIGVGGEAAYVF